MGAPRLLVVFTLAVLGVVGIVVVLATKNWWLLPFVLLAHGAAFFLVFGATRAAVEQQSKRDPVTEARLEEEGGPAAESEPETSGGDDEPRMAI